jgi:catechol 2,3-dioxygenase-like lactoylglutathione lyase family enzyme
VPARALDPVEPHGGAQRRLCLWETYAPLVLVGLGHVDLVCRDLGRSLAFYAAVFGPLGLEAPFLVEGERGEQIHYLRFPAVGSGSIGLRQALEAQEFELYAPGFHHLALAVGTQEDVDSAHAAAVKAGAEVLHPPRLWPQYHPAYYATFFLDPDGFRIEVATSRDARYDSSQPPAMPV